MLPNTPNPEKLGNKYILLDIIGTGGMAEVYRGKLVGEKGFEKLIVIKKLLAHIAKEPEMVTHFTNEARLAALLQHENVTSIYEYGETDGSFFIVMEHLFGKDLSSIMNKLREIGTPFAQDMALAIIAKVCEGMAYAHTLSDLTDAPLNIIHRDLTPQNIFLTYEGKVKILDFGIAKTSAHDNKTKMGVVKGKVNYMSPEQIMGENLDARSDIFSIGILLYELLSGAKFYTGETGEIIRKSVQVDYIPLEELVPDLATEIYSIVEKATQRDIELRYQSCNDMLKDILECLQNISGSREPRVLQDFIRSIFSNEYVEEKEYAKRILSISQQDKPQVQFDKTVFIEPEINSPEQHSDSMRYAPKNTEKDTLKKPQNVTPSVVPPEIQPKTVPIDEPKAPQKRATQQEEPATKVSHEKNKITLEQKAKRKAKEKPNIPIKDTRYKGPGKAYPKIDIETKERPASKRRLKTGLDFSSITRSFGPFIIIVLLLVAGAGYYLSSIQEDDIKDIYAATELPTVPPVDMVSMDETKKQMYVLKLILKGDSALSDGKLISPEGKNAFVYFHQLKAIDPANTETTQKLKQLTKQLGHKADVALQGNKKREASQLIISGLSIAPNDKKLLMLKEELLQ